MKFTVGELAKLHGMSKQTLIYYDNIDLFKPNIVDENNGYRYYTSEQLEVLDSILILREIGIPIKEIKEFLVKRDDNKALHLLKQQKIKLDEQVKNIQRTIKRLENKIDTIESLDNYKNDVYFEEMELEYLVLQKVEAPFDLLQTDIAFKKLLTTVTNNKYPYYYQLGTIIALENLLLKKYTTADSVFFPLYKKLKGENVIEKSKGLYAVALHKGEYSSIGKTYEILIKNINKNNYKMIGPSFEYGILDSLTSYTSKDYITKIAIPIKAQF
ncbi:MerR family transcriptional regulator [Paeniclostridium sp. NSJ-45]|uniref:MerR family transcriptional regulator n=1 Tax=Paeniclostridium hominis TaxID=2764329 RepID=A0ABR7K374_9FIRM|nr:MULTISPECIES: MerR family transcriptional regulator [Paeniclostridium]MBC6003566.1 MerR family transcriptional regulator [Paeniclostridium hominis]